MGRKNNLIGKIFARLTVLEDSGKRKRSHVVWTCVCECGNICEVIGYRLTSGNTKSCGCLKREEDIRRMRIHGDSGTRLYYIWVNMKARCYRKNNDSYKYYGARGIVVCSSWRNNFLAFKGWALSHGYKKGLSIDRRNHDGNYRPRNCRWITRSENAKKAARDRKAKNFKPVTYRARGLLYDFGKKTIIKRIW